ncbi:MAG: NADH-quinone oxidoreductase subunit J [Deltaproteobacteria bacterium]|nr:NADH-quinone oxidoreductase subunit J [Deltaproteobacteria bacterium]
MTAADAMFLALAATAVIGAAGVAFSRHILYSALSLMVALFGVAGLFVTLSADFVAGVQVLIYVGGVLVITLFAVMLTQGIQNVEVSNRAVGSVAAGLLTAGLFVVLLRAMSSAQWVKPPADVPTQTSTYGIGNALLGQYVLPFEVASLVLLAVLVGAVVLTRKETAE